MPSKTFDNLSDSKKKRLIDAAMVEFSKEQYHDVSINKIIANAKIPRGSFYMYFKDKEDLFMYLIELNRNRLNEIIKSEIIKNNGDLRNSFIKLYDLLINKVIDNNYEGLFKNFFIFFNIKRDKTKHPVHLLFEYVHDDIKLDNININENELEFVFGMFIHNLLFALIDTIKNNNKNDIKRQYLAKLDIICYGVYKEVLNV